MKRLLIAAAAIVGMAAAVDAKAYTPVYEHGMLTAIKDIQIDGHPDHRFTATFVDRPYTKVVGDGTAYMYAVAAYNSPDHTYKDAFTSFVTSLLSTALGKITPSLPMAQIRGCLSQECWLLTPNSHVTYDPQYGLFLAGAWFENAYTGEYSHFKWPPIPTLDSTSVGNDYAWVIWTGQ